MRFLETLHRHIDFLKYLHKITEIRRKYGITHNFDNCAYSARSERN